MEVLSIINWCIAAFFVVCFSYQLVYIVISLLKKPRRFPAAQNHRFAVMIAARNEEKVIGYLIQSVRRQKYPPELIDIFVAADNCTDHTAKIARAAGATVWKRCNKKQVGKGFALKFLFDHVQQLYGPDRYDGYFVFDADNLLDDQFVAEMNKVFSAGYRVITSYRNSKNYATNWISAGYALSFLRDARLMNQPRMLLGISCSVAGTGFLVHKDIVRQNSGWKHFMLSEDTEFSVDSILQGECIGYCPTAIIYDEQPVTFRQSWIQRERWAKGYWQVFRKYGSRLLRCSFGKPLPAAYPATIEGTYAYRHRNCRNCSCFDMSMCIMPAVLLTIVSLLINLVATTYSIIFDRAELMLLLDPLIGLAVNAYLMFFLIGLITGLAEWKQIRCAPYKKLLSFLTFPIFQFTYLPITAAALCHKIEWKPIRHTVSVSSTDMQTTGVG